MAERPESLLGVNRVAQPESAWLPADEMDSWTATFDLACIAPECSAVTDSYCIDHAEGFSVDLDQCSCFMGEFVAPSAEQPFREIKFLVAMREPTNVCFFSMFVT